MPEFSVLKMIEEAEKMVDNSTPEELEEILNKDSIQIQYGRIKKWEILRGNAELSSNTKKEDILKIINLVQFVRLSILDLHIVFNQFIKEDGSELERRLSFRICAMMIYEIIQDVPEMLGKKIRTTIKNLTNDDKEIREDLNELSKEIGTLQKETLTEFIRDIRIISIAHKDHDSKKLFETMETITEKEVLTLTTYIFAWNRQFDNFLEKLVKKF